VLARSSRALASGLAHGGRVRSFHEPEDDAIGASRRSIHEALSDPTVAPALTREGVLHDPRTLMDPDAAEVGRRVAHQG